MNENVKKWVAALRSGKYNQYRGSLKNEETFCCLGVACDLYKNEVGGSWVNRFFEVSVSESSSSCLPVTVRNWLGLKSDNGVYYNNSLGLAIHSRCLSSDNDRGKTFNEIADIIESKPQGLFND